ncbi:hypothetical protein [Micromonospora sediminicola]|uniref:hypothetical protein n=1 Tax=Micromonospora sediminicola TaxID=946078 RepID=UPI00379A3E98
MGASNPNLIGFADEFLDDLPGAFEVENEVRGELDQVVQDQHLRVQARRFVGGQQGHGALVRHEVDDHRGLREPEREHRECVAGPHFDVPAPLGTQFIEPLDEASDVRPLRCDEGPCRRRRSTPRRVHPADPSMITTTRATR